MAYPQPTWTPVAEADEETRGRFMVQVYQHVALAVLAFMAFETLLFVFGLAERLNTLLFGGGGTRWLLVLGGFMLVNMLVDRSASQVGNAAAQYGALFALSAAYAVIFAPFLYWVLIAPDGTSDVVVAAAITLVGFAVLSVVGLTTRKDLSFLRPLVLWGGIAALGLIVVAVVFQFALGPMFSVAMIGLAGATMLYQTQKIVRDYPEWAYVAAAVGLFGSLMTMFWYVLRLVARR